MMFCLRANPPLAEERGVRALGLRWNGQKIILFICVFVVASRMYTILIGGGWEDRSQFFAEGELRPGILDFIFNEILIYYLLARVIIYRLNWLVCTIIIVSAFAYYTRVPLTLMFVALLLARELSLRLKLAAAGVVAVISFVVLYLRIGEDLIYSDNASIFYISYPVVGLARLFVTSPIADVTGLHYLTLFLKPFDAVIFMVDYSGGYAGELSAGRFAGLELARFEYIQSLQGGYNAFGTVLYPFVLIAGWVLGPILFLLFLAFQMMCYSFATYDSSFSRRYIYFLLLTGLLFSWTSPFVWLVPFLFTKFRGREGRRAVWIARRRPAKNIGYLTNRMV